MTKASCSTQVLKKLKCIYKHSTAIATTTTSTTISITTTITITTINITTTTNTNTNTTTTTFVCNHTILNIPQSHQNLRLIQCFLPPTPIFFVHLFSKPENC